MKHIVIHRAAARFADLDIILDCITISNLHVVRGKQNAFPHM